MKSLPRLLAVLTLLFTLPLNAQDEKKPDVKKTEKKPVKTRVLKAASRNPQVKPLELKVPVTWKDVKSSSRMRAATVAIPPTKGDKEPAELAVFIFGAQSIDQNIDRWVGQFKADGRKSKITKGKRKADENKDYYMVELSGTFKKSIGPPIMQKTQDMPGYRMLGVLIPSKTALYVLKLTGPDKTVAAQAKAFRTAIGGDVKTEKKHGRD